MDDDCRHSPFDDCTFDNNLHSPYMRIRHVESNLGACMIAFSGPSDKNLGTFTPLTMRPAKTILRLLTRASQFWACRAGIDSNGRIRNGVSCETHTFTESRPSQSQAYAFCWRFSTVCGRSSPARASPTSFGSRSAGCWFQVATGWQRHWWQANCLGSAITRVFTGCSLRRAGNPTRWVGGCSSAWSLGSSPERRWPWRSTTRWRLGRGRRCSVWARTSTRCARPVGIRYSHSATCGWCWRW